VAWTAKVNSATRSATWAGSGTDVSHWTKATPAITEKTKDGAGDARPAGG
jgi:hypothetical protein